MWHLNLFSITRVKGDGYNFSEGNSVKSVLLSSEKGSTLKGKNLLQLGANSFLFRVDPFQKGFGMHEGKPEVKKLRPLYKIVENLPSV